ncbi:hypothetical protein G7046_g5297 [Stylonectria norvegica]|nr:hypothetical protein G7046_g5297 [Stylonectria norvegica]
MPLSIGFRFQWLPPSSLKAARAVSFLVEAQRKGRRSDVVGVSTPSILIHASLALSQAPGTAPERWPPPNPLQRPLQQRPDPSATRLLAVLEVQEACETKGFILDGLMLRSLLLELITVTSLDFVLERLSSRGAAGFVEFTTWEWRLVDPLKEQPTTKTTQGWRLYGCFETLRLVTFIIALNSTIIYVAQTIIAKQINAPAIQALRCGAKFLLASTVIQRPVPSLSHIFSRQPALVASLIIFSLSSVSHRHGQDHRRAARRPPGQPARAREVARLISPKWAIGSIIGFGFHIMHSSKDSRCDLFIRPRLFKSATALSAYFATVIHGIIAWCIIYYIPLYYERESSPLQAGVSLLPCISTVVPAAVGAGLPVFKTGLYRPYVWIGWVLIPLGMGLMMLLKRNTAAWRWVLSYLIGGMGPGMLLSAQAVVAQASASNADLPFAGCMYAFNRSLVQRIGGVAVGGVTFQDQSQSKIRKSDDFADKANEWERDAAAFAQFVQQLPPI